MHRLLLVDPGCQDTLDFVMPLPHYRLMEKELERLTAAQKGQPAEGLFPGTDRTGQTAGRDGPDGGQTLRPSVLAVLPDHPHPVTMGGRVRNLAILEALATHFDLEIITLVHDPRRLEEPGAVARLGRWTPVLAEHRRSPSTLLGQLRYRPAGRGWERETWFLGSPALARAVGEAHPGSSAADRPQRLLVHLASLAGAGEAPGLGPRHPRRPVRALGTPPGKAEREWSGRRKSPNSPDATAWWRSRRTMPRSSGPSTPPGMRIETIGMGVDVDHWSRAAIGSPGRGERDGLLRIHGQRDEPSRRDPSLQRDPPRASQGTARREVVIIGADPAPDVHAARAPAGSARDRCDGRSAAVSRGLRRVRALSARRQAGCAAEPAR